MIIRSISIENWGPYFGRHTLELSNTVYGIIGRHENDINRSNWLGKSWLLYAIRFALTGVRPDHLKNEDSWISRGKNIGGVILVLDDGSVIRRTRVKGKGTQLSVDIGGSKAKQVTAQKLINDHIGLNHKDFDNSCFIRQKHISQLILTKSSILTEIASNWFRLGKVQEAYDYQKKRLNQFLQRRSIYVSKLNDLRNRCSRIDVGKVKKQINKLNTDRDKYQHKLDSLNENIDGLNEWTSHYVRSQEYDSLVKEGKSISEYISNNKVDKKKYDSLSKKCDNIYAKYTESRSRYLYLKSLHEGDTEFDGECPVMCRECPTADDVRRFVITMEEKVQLAEQEVDQYEEKYENIKSKLSEYGKHKDKLNRMDLLRNRVIELSDSYMYIQKHGIPQDLSVLRKESESIVNKISDINHELMRLESEVSDYVKYNKVIKTYEDKINKLNIKVKISQEAIDIFGRNGVQKIIAVTALDEIEVDANQSLVDAGINLFMEVSWFRPGQGLATQCETCGFIFPMSRKVKRCEKCNSKRGSKIVNELNIIPSNRSGGADDIAGLTFQLSAAKWLRTNRCSDWSVVFIDEPFGALDKTNSTLLGNYIYSMIRRNYSFDQGFIVAHESSIMDSLPAKICVIGSDKGSRLEVINGK